MEHRDTSRGSGLCWPRQRSQDKSSMWELKKGLACDALKTAMPQYTSTTQTGIKEGNLLRGDGQVVLLPSTSYREITGWTVKTLAEQSEKYTGAVGSKIRPARQLTHFYLCVSPGDKYILQQVAGKIRSIILLKKKIRKTKLLNAKAEGRGEQ